MDHDQIAKIAASLGLDCSSELLLFAIEMQALSLMEFSKFCRTADSCDRISWVDAAINAELAAAQLNPLIINTNQ